MNKRVLAYVLCGLITLLAIGFMAHYMLEKNKPDDFDASQYSSELSSSEVSSSEVSSSEASSSEVSSSEPEPEPIVIPIDFEKLWETNKDAYAWIEITGTDTKYPIMQHENDDLYYLDYTFEKNYGLPGSIYTERCDGKDFTDFNTLIYGHDMLNGSMFGELSLYSDPEYLEEHREIIIYTPTDKLVFKVVAAILYDNRHINKYFDESTVEGRQELIDSMLTTKNYSTVIAGDYKDLVNTDSRLITLSTCFQNQKNNRFLVQAVYVGNRQEQPKDDESSKTTE